MDFLDSTFFSRQQDRRELPTPNEVLAESTDSGTTSRPKPVAFEHLNLIVKFGPLVIPEEAMCLRMLRQTLHPKVPVPEVFGWKIEKGTTFIYMELIRGVTLASRWDHISDEEKTAVCAELKNIVSELRQLKQPKTDSYIGSINRGRLGDYVFLTVKLPVGPFNGVREFNEWFSVLPQLHVWGNITYQDPYRSLLPDEGEIKFTHGDLHRGNIMITSTGPARILAIIDWAHAGWYPEYWEYCKALYTSDYRQEWRIRWIPEFLSSYEDEFFAFSEYTTQMGAV